MYTRTVIYPRIEGQHTKHIVGFKNYRSCRLEHHIQHVPNQ